MYVAEGPLINDYMQADLLSKKIPPVLYRDAFYSDDKDVPDHSREYAGKEFKLESTALPFLPEFNPTGTSLSAFGDKRSVVSDRSFQERAYARRRRTCTFKTWEIQDAPPTKLEVWRWLQDEIKHVADLKHGKGEPEPRKEDISQVEDATQKDRHGFKYSQKQKSTSVKHETQYMSIMSLEVHVNTRGNLMPDPEQDKICCVFWCIQSEDEDLEVNGVNEGTHVGILALSESGGLAHTISSASSRRSRARRF